MTEPMLMGWWLLMRIGTSLNCFERMLSWLERHFWQKLSWEEVTPTQVWVVLELLLCWQLYLVL